MKKFRTFFIERVSFLGVEDVIMTVSIWDLYRKGSLLRGSLIY